MTFWCGSGSGDPCLWLMDTDPDADPDPAIFVIDLQDENKKKQLKKKFFCLLLFEGTFTSFFKDKKSKRSHKNSRSQGFSYYFCLMIEGSGSIPLTRGSGSRRPKTMRIRWFRICNTGFFGLRMLKYFDADTDPGSFWPLIRDWKIRIWDPA